MSGLFSFPLGEGPSGEAGPPERLQGGGGVGGGGDFFPVNPYSFELADILSLLLNL